jgi:hypothetical protein
MRFIASDNLTILVKWTCFETFAAGYAIVFHDDSRACLRVNDYCIDWTGKEAFRRIALSACLWRALAIERVSPHVYSR